MRIEIISTMSGSSWGGSEELWATVATEALIQGHHVGIAAYRWPTLHPKIEALRDRGARIMLRRRWGSGPISRRVVNLQRLFRDAMRFRPDVVLVSQGGTYDCVTKSESGQLRNFLMRAGVPFVVICHGNDESQIPNSPNRMATRDLFGRAAKVAFVSKRMVQVVERQLFASIPNSHVIRNPVNLKWDHPVEWPTREGLQMAFVARLDSNKGLDLLLEALATTSWSRREWGLGVFGDGSHRDYYAQLAAYYGLATQVQFHGHVPDIRAIWHKHHLMVLSSRSEGVPLVMVEAMLCGRPVLITDVGGIREWVSENETGFIAEAATTYSVGSALERAWQARKHLPAMGQRAFEVASAQIDQNPGRTLLDLLSSVARGQSVLGGI